MIELPEVEKMHQIGWSPAIPEQLRVAGTPRHLRGELVRPEPAERPVQRDARAGKTILPQERRDRQGILRLRHRVQVPAIQFAELLAVLADVEPDMSGQAGPVRVAFLEADVPVFETDEDLRMRVRIERRLKPDFELSRVEIVALHTATA